MAIYTIKLQGGEWQYDDSKLLGEPGGYGEVFFGSGSFGNVAIKRLKLSADQAAHRELNIGQQLMQGSFNHIVPIFDVGQDAESDRYFLVMPVCDFNLQDKINEANGAVSIEVARSAITGIISGLTEVSNITHRDLKPANILFHEGVWKIADFGIAKFVEDSTSAETVRSSLTPTYAAPEQWKGERPTSSTDVYALGCIIHALLTGSPPFIGSKDELQESHLQDVPTPIAALAPRFSGFVSHMLRKPPAARPTLERCSKVLAEMDLVEESSEVVHSLIDQASLAVAEKEANEEAKKQVALALRRQRQELGEDARKSLSGIREKLMRKIANSSESVNINSSGYLQFGDAILAFERDAEFLEEIVLNRHASNNPYSKTGWDVVSWTILAVTCRPTSYTWSASLLFADIKNGDGFRWYEVAFWKLAQTSDRNEPFGLAGYKQDIDFACGSGMHSVNAAYGPLPIDSEDEDGFINRWIDLVAKAAIGSLNRPSTMPISDFK